MKKKLKLKLKLHLASALVTAFGRSVVEIGVDFGDRWGGTNGASLLIKCESRESVGLLS